MYSWRIHNGTDVVAGSQTFLSCETRIAYPASMGFEGEVVDYVGSKASEKDENGHRLVVRNGYLPRRGLVTGVGPV